MKTIKILFLLVGLFLSSMGFAVEAVPEKDLRLIEAILTLEDVANGYAGFDGSPEQVKKHEQLIKNL